jgi:L-threonylcarbamoyladenylate synthase
MSRPLPEVLPAHWVDDAPEPSEATLAALMRAADVLRAGGLVAIPTETVYGLAAVATDAAAVRSIFAAKERVATNPLIVHVADVAMARRLAAEWPESAEALATALWPGPLTLVVPRGPGIPDEVTAGGPTVALRCPAHRLTRRLIRLLGAPLAAPSANRSLAVSPTTAAHVLDSLGARVDLVLDGGPCAHGIESTVVDCTVSPPRVLRPGPVSAARLSTTLGVEVGAAGSDAETGPVRSPGRLARHYAPRTPLESPARPAERVATLLSSGVRVGWLTCDAVAEPLASSPGLVVMAMPADPAAYAARLYAALHELDALGLDALVADPLPDTDAWRAVRDRLQRAAHG